MNSPNNVWVEWCGDYEIHYAHLEDFSGPAAGPVIVYYPLTEEAFVANFLPTPDLTDPTSPDYAPNARPIMAGDTSEAHCFAVTPEGIRSNHLSLAGLTGIVARLLETGGFRHVFQRGALPPTRWENARLARVPVSIAVETYADALRREYRNGFVEVRAYRIEAGAVEDAVVKWKRSPWLPTGLLEILRHPAIKSDFGAEGMDAESLLQPSSWKHYSPFLFSGVLAETLAYGGAYSPVPASPLRVSDALRFADEAFAAFQRDYRDLELHVSHEPWCARFCNVAWDHTWIIFEPSWRKLTILLASDTD